MCCTQLAENTGCKECGKKSPSVDHCTTLLGYIFTTKACVDNWEKNLLSGSISSTCAHSMMNFGPLMAEIGWRVWGTSANFNRFRVLASLFLQFGQQHSADGTTYTWLGGHHVGLGLT